MYIHNLKNKTFFYFFKKGKKQRQEKKKKRQKGEEGQKGMGSCTLQIQTCLNSARLETHFF